MNQSAAIPEGSVVITPFQMYQEQQEMNKTLTSVATTLDALKATLDHAQEDQSRRMEAIDGKDGRLAKLESRMDGVERSSWKTTGAAALASAVLTSGGAALVIQYVLSHH